MSKSTPNLGLNFFLATAAGVLTFCSIFIGFFEGPQTAHYINLTAMLIAIGQGTVLMYRLRVRKDLFNHFQKHVIFLFFTVAANLLISAALIQSRYGYSNWGYKNLLEMEFPRKD